MTTTKSNFVMSMSIVCMLLIIIIMGASASLESGSVKNQSAPDLIPPPCHCNGCKPCTEYRVKRHDGHYNWKCMCGDNIYDPDH